MKHLASIVALMMITLTGASLALADEDAVLAAVKSKFPQATSISVKKAPMEGLYEVVMDKNIVYTDAKADLLLIGHIYDVANNRDLTQERITEISRIDVSKLPVKNALKTVKGNGKRTLYVFSDPECPYCRVLEKTLDGIDNVTVYTFFFPLISIHPEAEAKAISVWCSRDRNKAWHDLMLDGKAPKSGTCRNPVADNIALGESLGISGTPTMYNARGELHAGALSVDDMNKWLVK